MFNYCRRYVGQIPALPLSTVAASIDLTYLNTCANAYQLTQALVFVSFSTMMGPAQVGLIGSRRVVL